MKDQPSIMPRVSVGLINRSQFTALVKSFISKFSETACGEMFRTLSKKVSESKSSLKKDG